MNRKKIMQLAVSLVCGILAALATYAIHQNRDLLFDWDWVKPVGTFRAEENAEMAAAAIAYLQKSAPAGQVCVGRWAGHDDRYVYMAAGCAQFSERLGEIVTSGDRNYHPTRFRFNMGLAEHYEQPDESQLENSMKRLFPKEAVNLIRVRLNETDFKKQGLAKMPAN